MKTALVTAAILAAGLVNVADARENPGRSIYTCSGVGLSRVALSGEPAPCCDRMLGCPRLLGSTGFEKPKHDNHT